ESVVLEVAEAASDPPAQLDDPVDRLGTTVAGTVGIEVRQDRRLPRPQRPAQPGDLRDRARRQGLDHAGSEQLALGERDLVEHVSDVQGALVGDLNADVILVRGERCLQPCLLSLGEAFASGPQEGPDAVERVALATPVPESLLLDTTADVINSAGGQLDDMKRIQNAGGVFQLV